MTGWLLYPQRLYLPHSTRIWRSRPVSVPPTTGALTLSIQRPKRMSRSLWSPDDRVRVRVCYLADKNFYVATGQARGGTRDNDYQLHYNLQYGLQEPGYEWMATNSEDEPHWHHHVPLHWCGQLARTRLAWIEIEALDGRFLSEQIAGEFQVIPSGEGSIHHSVAYDNATDISESGGDGVVSVSLTPIGTTNLGAWFAQGVIGDSAQTHTGTVDGSASGVTELYDGGVVYVEHAAYVKPAIGVGSATYQCNTTTVSPSWHAMAAVTFTGVNQTTMHTGVATSTGSGTSVSDTAGSITSDDMAIDMLIEGFGGAPTIGADQTERATETDVDYFFRASSQPGSAGGVMSWTLTGSPDWAHGAVTIVAAAGGPSVAQTTPAMIMETSHSAMIGRRYV